jgi:hypothetical protein
MEKEKVFIQKPKLFISRIKKNHYNVIMTVENPNIFMEKILNFNLIKVIFEVNKNYFESCLLEENENGTEGNLYLLVKPLFKELGVYQRYISLHVTKHENKNNGTIDFVGVSFPEYGEKKNLCKKAMMAPIKEMPISSQIYNAHKMSLTIQIILEDDFEIPSLLEKIFINLLKDSYSKTIDFLEKITG